VQKLFDTLSGRISRIVRICTEEGIPGLDDQKAAEVLAPIAWAIDALIKGLRKELDRGGAIKLEIVH
jgi:hypothetical protein